MDLGIYVYIICNILIIILTHCAAVWIPLTEVFSPSESMSLTGEEWS